jgi:hypothetical protein
MDAGEGSNCRALVPLAPSRARGLISRAPRRHTAFLVHLIAMEKHAPQTRLRRRVEPHEAAAAYRARLARRVTTGRFLSVSA